MAFPFNNIQIRIIPHGCQRYDTYGDYWIDEKNILQVRVSEFADPDIAIRIAVHELMEAWRCSKKGIDFAEIDRFDIANIDHHDPGIFKCAPYHHEHMQSMDIERLLCIQDGVKWEEYYDAEPLGYKELPNG
jgi:hypothetical protein